MPVNASNAMTLAHQVRSYTLEAAGFTDTVDVLYVAQMMHKFVDYVTELREVGGVSEVSGCIALYICVLIYTSRFFIPVV